MREIDNYFLSQNEPEKSCLLALRDLIMEFDDRISMDWKYKTPFFTIQRKMFCYLWIDKTTKEPYIGFVKGIEMDHPDLELGDRSHIKILRIDPSADIHVEKIYSILGKAIQFYI